MPKQQDSKPLISIVIPVYNEAKNIPLLHAEISKHIAKLSYNFEILMIDDGSQDNSAEAIEAVAAKDPRVKFMQLARNFGKEATVSAGLHRARGQAAIAMDADLQMPPALIGKFLEKWEAGAEVVVGVFTERNNTFIRRTGARIFYRIMNRIGHTKITPHATDYRLLDREVIDIFNDFTERNRNTRGLIDWLGFKRDYIPFTQAERQHGSPTYSFKKLVELAINSFTAFSLLPLKIAGYIGILILTLSIPLGALLYIERYMLENPLHWSVTGTTMLAVLNLFLVGVVLACLGLIALYIAHIHTEVTNRPLYVVRRTPAIDAHVAVAPAHAAKKAKARRRRLARETEGAGA